MVAKGAAAESLLILCCVGRSQNASRLVIPSRMERDVACCKPLTASVRPSGANENEQGAKSFVHIPPEGNPPVGNESKGFAVRRKAPGPCQARERKSQVRKPTSRADVINHEAAHSNRSRNEAFAVRRKERGPH